jgi:phosphatidylinositol glycan class O
MPTMEHGEIFTPASEITAPRDKVVSNAQPPKRSGAVVDEDKAKRAGQVHFKAAHGLVVAFFTFILYV